MVETAERSVETSDGASDARETASRDEGEAAQIGTDQSDERIAVVDIGSNSIRLVVFEGLKRVPMPVFNEKVICGLGRELASTGRLSEEAVELALPNLQRFALLAEGMGVRRVEMLATAAAREAENGPDFVAEVERRTGLPVTVLSGEEEARIAAQGVVSGMPGADGVMGDLGGGSLELVRLENGRIGPWATLPLGPLRLADRTDGSRAAIEAEVSRHLSEVPWLNAVKGGNFYAVGGAWRAISKILMDQRSSPLQVIHGYGVPRAECDELMRLLAGLGRRSLSQMPGVSRRRADSVPYASVLLRAVGRAFGARNVIWSSYGLREGYLFEQLPEAERDRDPLLAISSELSSHDGRFEGFGAAMARWTGGLFPDEKPEEARLREATAHLADISWREHPDHRARQSVWRLLYFPFAGVDHSDRAFLATAVHARYGGSTKDSEVAAAYDLLSSEGRDQARVLGLAVRLAYAVAAGVPSLLDRTALLRRDGKLVLRLPADGSVPPGTAIERRFAALSDAADIEGEILLG